MGTRLVGVGFAISLFLFTGWMTPSAVLAQSTPNEIAGIRKTIDAATEAFNKHDAKALASLYTADGTFANEKGRRYKGTAEIEKAFAAEFASTSKSANMKTSEVEIERISPDLAVATIRVTVAGELSANGSRLAARNQLVTAVLRREAAEVWYIVMNRWWRSGTC